MAPAHCVQRLHTRRGARSPRDARIFRITGSFLAILAMGALGEVISCSDAEARHLAGSSSPPGQTEMSGRQGLYHDKETPEPYGAGLELHPPGPPDSIGVVDPDDPPPVLVLQDPGPRGRILDVQTTVDKTAYSWFGSVQVSALVRRDGTAVPDCDSVVVVSAANPRVRARLRDDGIPPDAAAGDGIYTGHFDVGAGEGEARPTGSYNAVATAYNGGDSGAGSSPSFSLYSVRRWTGITTTSLPDPSDAFTAFFVVPLGGGYRHSIRDLGLVRSVAATDAQIRIPILPPENDISNVTVTGPGVSDVSVHGNIICFACNLQTSVTRVTIEFDSPSDLATTRIDRYQTGDIALRDFRNGYLVWNRYIHTAILGSGYSSPHGPGCVVDLHVTDLVTGNPRTVDCMERVAVHLDGAAHNDGTGTYPSNIKWGGDALSWYQGGDLERLEFAFVSGGNYGLSNKVLVNRTVEFLSGTRFFRHHYAMQNTDHLPHTFDFVWGKEQWLYGSAAGSNRSDGDRGFLPNDPVAWSAEYEFDNPQIDGTWFGAFDLSSFFSIAVLLERLSPHNTSDQTYFLCHPPLRAGSTGQYPISASGSCSDMANVFFEKNLGVLAPGETSEFEFHQWGGYGATRDELTEILWKDAVRVSGAPMAVSYGPVGDDVPVTTAVDLWFNNAMDPAATETAFQITPGVSGTFEWGDGYRHMRFVPNAHLSPHSIYHIELARSAADAEGRPLATAAGWYFETASSTDVPDGASQAGRAALRAAPSPFTRATEISFGLETAGRVSLRVYDAQGRLVCTLADRLLAPGRHSLIWKGEDGKGATLAGGVYFCRLDRGDGYELRKIVIGR